MTIRMPLLDFQSNHSILMSDDNTYTETLNIP